MELPVPLPGPSVKVRVRQNGRVRVETRMVSRTVSETDWPSPSITVSSNAIQGASPCQRPAAASDENTHNESQQSYRSSYVPNGATH